MSNLQGKVVVITGGNSGIGLAAAQEFAQQGAKVAIFGRNADTLAEAAQQVGSDVLTVQGEVTQMADLERLFTETEATLGKVDALFVNAGVGKFAPVEAVSEELFDEMMNINFKGAFFTIQKALPHMNDGAAIVLNTSINATLGMPNTSIYAASKAAMSSLVRTLSADLLPRGIRVNAVSPGPVETPFVSRTGLPAEAVAGFKQFVAGQVPLKRMGHPAEIAKAVAFLASPDSSFIVGTEVVADGGMSQL